MKKCQKYLVTQDYINIQYIYIARANFVLITRKEGGA